MKSYAHETHGAEAIVISARIEEELIDLSSEKLMNFFRIWVLPTAEYRL